MLSQKGRIKDVYTTLRFLKSLFLSLPPGDHRKQKLQCNSPSAESRNFGFMALSRGTVETCHILTFD